MTVYTCLFEAKSIQGYILRSGRLRHIVGASEMIESLTADLLDSVLEALCINEGKQVQFSRRAGGGVYLFCQERETRDAFRDLWSLVVRQYAPGLEFVVAGGQGSDAYTAYRQAREQLQAARNRLPADLPSGGPVTAYAARTGLPAVKGDGKLGMQDAATARFGLGDFWKLGRLTKKFAAELPVDAWPRNLEHDSGGGGRHFPFLPDNRYLGVLHADGNGLGQLLMRLGEDVKTAARAEVFVPLFRDFSEVVARATEAAARDATRRVLLNTRRDVAEEEQDSVPARPIVLGGDDLTVILRADIALPFARVFLESFERESHDRLVALRKKYKYIPGLPDALTAGAGIAFVKSSHPFHLAHGLAESLAGYAKAAAKQNRDTEGRIPPTVAFHRVTTGGHGEYARILETELTYGPQSERVRTTLGVYGIDPHSSGLPALNDLEELAGLLGGEELARGPTRQILTLLGRDLDDARRRYSRWREVMEDRSGSDEGSVIKRMDALMTRLCGTLSTRLPVSKTGDPPATPLGDVVTLLSVSHGAAGDSRFNEESAT